MRTEQIEKKNQNKATEKSVFQALNINGTCKKTKRQINERNRQRQQKFCSKIYWHSRRFLIGTLEKNMKRIF